MPKWAHADVLDQGTNYIKVECDKLYLIKAYAAGDSFATVQGNMVAEVAMASGDFTLGNGASSARTLTTASGKSDSAANAGSGASPNLHLAFVDEAASKVLWVTDETTDQVITAGNPVDFPSVVYTSGQPT